MSPLVAGCGCLFRSVTKAHFSPREGFYCKFQDRFAVRRSEPSLLMENRLVHFIFPFFLPLALAVWLIASGGSIRPGLVFDTYLNVQTTASTPRFNQLGFNLFQEHDLRFGDRIKPKRIVVDIQQEETKGPSSMFASYSWFIHYMFIVVCTSSVSSCSFHEQHCGNNITRHSSIPIHSIHFPPWRRPKRFWRPVLFHWDDFSEEQMRWQLKDVSLKAYSVEEEARETSKCDKFEW